MDNVVEIEGLIECYASREVVREINLSAPTSRCFGVLGPNGVGKAARPAQARAVRISAGRQILKTCS